MYPKVLSISEKLWTAVIASAHPEPNFESCFHFIQAKLAAAAARAAAAPAPAAALQLAALVVSVVVSALELYVPGALTQLLES